MSIESIEEGMNGIVDAAKGALGSPVFAGASGVVVGAGLGGAIATAVARRKKSRKKTTSKKGKKRVSRKSSRRKRTTYARTAGKRRDTSRRRIRQTKNGQPYIILASGKARFISKRSAKASRSRKGGRY